MVSVVEVTNIRTYSRKSNKLQNIYIIGRGTRTISIKKRKNKYFKIKIILFIIKFRGNYAIRYGQVQVQKGGFSIKAMCLL